MTDDSQIPEAELARLADGSLPETRQAELQAELQRSPALTSALGRAATGDFARARDRRPGP